MPQEKIISSLLLLQNYIEDNNYKGYDPYDALTSPYFKAPILKNNKLIRFGTQQLVKRFPFNLRPLLRIPKGYNPVTLGLCIQGYAYLTKVFPEKKDSYIEKILYLITELVKMIPKGFSGACWGYDFDWEARHAKIPAYQPTIVATGIITNSLYIAWEILQIDECKNLIISASKFVLENLNRTYKDDAFCFSYSPFDKQRVFNASMKGVRLLAQTYSITKEDELRAEASKAVKYVIKYQQLDGCWAYSLATRGGWVDNYHTGYILDCLDTYIKFVDDILYLDNIKRGYNYYVNNFFENSGLPKFYNNNPYPIDCTAGGQSLLTLISFGDTLLADKVANYMIFNMQSKRGSFYFRKFRYYTIKIPFMRWSNAWMFVGISKLLSYKVS